MNKTLGEEFEPFERKVQQRIPEVTATARWGHHQLLLNGKIFATYSAAHMTFKLDGSELQRAFDIPGAEVWNPTNKKNQSKN